MKRPRVPYRIYEATVWFLMWAVYVVVGFWCLIWMNWHVEGSIYLLPMYVLQSLNAGLRVLNDD